MVNISRSSFRYEARPDQNIDLRKRLRELAEKRRRFGCRRLYLLLRREGYEVNHKRVKRLYREENLSLRRKNKKRPSHLRLVLPATERINQYWSMDFVSDSLYDGRRFRALTVIDQYSREALAIEVDNSLTGHRVTKVLNKLCEMRTTPEAITVDNGPEFTSTALDKWAYENGVKLAFIRPGKPIKNAHIESFNGRFRDECLNENVFVSLHDARNRIESWREDYNVNRPHSGIQDLTPSEFAKRFKGTTEQTENANLIVVQKKG